MILIWRGFGIIVPAILVLSVGISIGIVDAVYNTGYYQTHKWPQVASICIAGVLVGWFGYLVNRKNSAHKRGLPSHSFFFIPIEFWSIIIFAFAIFIALNPNLSANQNHKKLQNVTISKTNQNKIQEQHKQDKQDKQISAVYLKTPKKNDKYVADFTKIFKKSGDKYKKNKYGILKVLGVSKENVKLAVSNISYATKDKTEKDITEKNDTLINYYSNKNIIIKRKLLMKLKSQNIIISAHRDE